MTSEAWSRVHHQYSLVQRILDCAQEQADPAVLGQFQHEIDAAFGGVDALLLHLERQLYLHLEALLEDVLDGKGEGALEPSTLSREIGRHKPMLREILNAYTEHPALQHANRRHPNLYRLARQVAAA